jgi:adenylate cyclase
LRRGQRRYEEAILEYEKVLGINRNFVGALAGLGWCKLHAGLLDDVIPLVEQAIRLSPRDPRIGHFYFRIGTVHLLQLRPDEAILWLEKACGAVPELPPARAFLASAYGLNGETERAASELAEARRVSSDDRFSSVHRLKAVGYFAMPKLHALLEATYFAGLRKAGMAEE